MAAGILDSTVQSQMQSAWDTFHAACTAASPSVDLSVISRKFESASLVGGLLVESAMGTQRRRQTQLR